MSNNLTLYNAARRALAKAASIPEVKDIRSKAKGMAEFAKDAKDRDKLSLATEMIKRAERRIGEMMEDLRLAGMLAKGAREVGSKRGTTRVHWRPASLANQGIDKHLADRARNAFKMKEGKFEAWVTKTVRIAVAAIENEKAVITAARVERHREKKAKRQKREREMGEKQIALPKKKYGVIYADPEWKFEFWNNETGRTNSSADNHYLTSELDAIKARDIPSITAEDAVLFLWATVPMLPQALEVMEAWDFKYVTNLAWDKLVPGTGYWFRNQHEILLLGRKGKIPAPAEGDQPASVLRAKRRKHSEKPDEVYVMIEKMFPTLPKVELNARKARKGWDSWGHEAPIAQAAE